MKIAAVIPAFNEAAHIGRVLSRVVRSVHVDEVIVVCDGCRDDTAAVARRYGVNVVELPENVGKGGAMMAGVQHTDADVILFLDADLIGLRAGHIYSLVEPVAAGRADMTIGVFADGRPLTDIAQKLAPFLTGQRAVRRDVLEQVPDLEQAGFGVEAALSRYADKQGLKVARVSLPGLAHVMKEEKAGLWKGFRARVQMYWEILRSYR
ncbi:MAG: glycosyltransferase family 2 protein [Limnochordales bacterium]|nr:MAG: glycosyl transferase family 2 [Bacillota bacterium]